MSTFEQPPTPAELAGRIAAGDRTSLSRAITLVESSRADHRLAARQLLAELGHPQTKPAVRVGISGTPGAGKSTFIEALGTMLTGQGHRVGVLAVDPSSPRTGGSVLGDRTRMHRLAADPQAYIRPSPTAGTLGGVARATAQTIPLLEAAGFDVILIETVGVGQSEVTVAQMVDTFLLLSVAGGGDQLQGIKKGVLEFADVIAINKADGDREQAATAAAKELTAALRLVHGRGAAWLPPVLTCSALVGSGVADVWAQCLRHRNHLGDNGLRERRAEQQIALTWTLVDDELRTRVRTAPGVHALLAELSAQLRAGEIGAAAAADQILGALG